MARGAITENGKAAVIARLNPFSDLPIQHLRGFPDYETAPSIVRTIRASTTISATGAGDNIMIFTWPIANVVETFLCVRRNAIIDQVIEDAGSDFKVGAVTISHYASLANMTLTSPTLNNTPVGLDPVYLHDSCRVIGMGVEVYDVTADLYKQGTLTLFQVPQSTSEPSVYVVGPDGFSGDTVLQTPVQGLPLKKFPTTLDQIMQLEGTRQWAAAEGAYIVTAFTGRDDFAGQPTYQTPLIYTGVTEAREEVDFLNTAAFNIGDWARPQVTDTSVVFLANKFMPCHSKGILLSGLNANSTFTINTVFYLESFPASDDTALVTLARPSAELDEVALEMMSTAVQKLPIGVPVCENGLGDWFAEVVAEVAPWIGAAAKGLGVGPVEHIAESAAGFAKSYMASSNYQNTGGFFAPKTAALVAAAKNAPSKQPQPPGGRNMVKKPPTAPVTVVVNTPKLSRVKREALIRKEKKKLAAKQARAQQNRK